MARQPKSITDYAVPTLREARALHAWSKGEASAEDQKIAFNWVVRGACRAGQEIFAPGQGDVTAYLAGRLSVSLQIGWVLAQPLDKFRQGEAD